MPVSITLILWKAPVLDHPDEAVRLLEPYYERRDDSAFEPSLGLAKVSNELRRRFPNVEKGPWAEDLPPKEVDRLLLLTIRRSADVAVLDEIVELARENDLVVYDPQGPSFYLPFPVPTGPIPPLPRTTAREYLKVIVMGVVAAGVFLLGWWIQVPVLNWILMIAGGFFFTVILFLFGILIVRPGRR